MMNHCLSRVNEGELLQLLRVCVYKGRIWPNWGESKRGGLRIE